MKVVKSVLVTMVCAIAILAVGYGGIIVSGERALTSSTEPEAVTMTGSISNLFYSRLEDDISLYPWNYCPEEASDLTMQEKEKFYAVFGQYLETEVLYTLISIAADVGWEEVEAWYEGREKTILTSMKQGVSQDGYPLELYFYDDVISLEEKNYQVKISCNSFMLLSFSCIQSREETVKESEEWNEKKEAFREAISENSEYMLTSYNYMASGYKAIQQELNDWYLYVDMYAYGRDMARETLKQRALWKDMTGESDYEDKETSASIGDRYREWIQNDGDSGIHLQEIPAQMIELKDSVLLVMGSEFTVGLYYDVIGQKIVGFHYFSE